MKYILIIIVIIFFTSCEDDIYEYPDGISKPNNIVESYGCGNIFVYQYLDSLKVLAVNINGYGLNLTKKSQTINLNEANPNSSVILEISGGHPDSIYFNFCNDVAFINTGVTKKYKATSGKLSFSVSEDNPIKEKVWESSYYATIKIENLHLYNQENNDKIVIDEIIFWNVNVGWLPG